MKFRKPNRLKGFGYSLGYSYFLTICVYDNHHVLSEIKDENSFLTEAGLMI
ncbi:MAG: hypothetical protein IT280_03630 [Ignavibacteria bacterium]|nr:hypothetical protein [Ignavibacteria bacterium]